MKYWAGFHIAGVEKLACTSMPTHAIVNVASRGSRFGGVLRRKIWSSQVAISDKITHNKLQGGGEGLQAPPVIWNPAGCVLFQNFHMDYVYIICRLLVYMCVLFVHVSRGGGKCLPFLKFSDNWHSTAVILQNVLKPQNYYSWHYIL